GVGVDPQRLLAAGGEGIAGHLGAAEVNLLVPMHAPHAVAAALQFAQGRFAGRLHAIGDRNEDGAEVGGARRESRWRHRREWRRVSRRGGKREGSICYRRQTRRSWLLTLGP